MLPLDHLVDEGGIGMLPIGLPDLRVLHIAPGGLGIAAVGKIIIVMPGHYGNAVASGGMEAAGVEAVGLAGQQHGVQMMRLQPGGDLLEMVHLRFLFSRMIGGGKTSLLWLVV